MIKYLGKCLFIEELKILVIGDLHLGYEESLNIGGIFVYRKMFEEMISYLNLVFERVGEVKEVVLLGDVKHEFGSILRQEWNDFSQFIDYLKKKSEKVIIVKGNHDRILEFLARKKNIEISGVYVEGKYAFVHGDSDFKEIWNDEIKFVILGHAHPAIKLKEGIKVEKYKCFLEGDFKRKRFIIVPSFVAYSEGSDPREQLFNLAWDIPLRKFSVKIVGKDLEVLDFGKLGKLK